MERKALGWARGFVGAAGVALVVAVFLPWTDGTAWAAEAAIAALCVLAGFAALVGAATDGQIGFFRPDLSSSAAADVLNVAATLAVGVYLLFGLPEGTSAGVGAHLALASAAVAACGSADWRVLRGAPLFPR